MKPIHSSINRAAHRSSSFCRIYIIVICLFCIYIYTVWTGSLDVADQTIVVAKGESLSRIATKLTTIDSYKLRRYARSLTPEQSKIIVGSYLFSGSVDVQTFVQTLVAGPSRIYIPVTILEGRSIYDTDHALATKGYIQAGEYSRAVADASRFVSLDPGISMETQFRGQGCRRETGMEGILFPDTYHVSAQGDFVTNLVTMQIKAFRTKVVEPLATKLDGRTRCDVIKLASIVQKEERNRTNMPIIAGLFYNRLANGTPLGADVTLCYGLPDFAISGYGSCTPSVIGQMISDDTNPYNTRRTRGLTPSPIASPGYSAIDAVVNYQPTSYIFYLHDPQGGIHRATTNAEHVENKRLYL